MTGNRHLRRGLALLLAVTLVGGGVWALRTLVEPNKTHLVAYFDNTNGLFPGDEIRILGVPVGAIDTIEPQPESVKVTFWVDEKYSVPADANAAIISPQLITARAIQLIPAYTGGPALGDGAVIPNNRTVVPMEWDDLRVQAEKLTDALQPTRPGGVSTLGEFVTTAAANLRGQGPEIRSTVISMSKALSALGDGSGDLFGTIRNLSVVVKALENSSAVLGQLNGNLATVTSLLSSDSGAIGQALSDVNRVVGDTTGFLRDNREAVGLTTDKLASLTATINDNIGDVKQALHVFPNAAQNFANIYQPAQGLTGAVAINNLADPIAMLCGSIQAAARLNAEHSAKLCVQYLAPIVKNRQYNFLPVGVNALVGATTRPNEITYTEEWMRPDHNPATATTGPEILAPAATSPTPDLATMLLPAEGGS
ncbi:MCE family protein [Mycolicibacterium sp. A43C]